MLQVKSEIILIISKMIKENITSKLLMREIKHLLKLLMQIANMMHILVLRRSDQHEDQANDEKQDHQKIILNNLMKNQMKFLNPIDPNSEEGRVNEKD